MAVIAILLAIVVGLLIWSLSLQGDLQNHERALVAVTGERDSLRQHATATAYRLAPTADGAPNASATVYFPIEGSGVLSATNLPKLGTNQRYQLWYRSTDNDTLIPGGTFELDPLGNGFMLIPNDVGRFSGLAISLEPASGSTAPTGPLLLQGDVSTARG